MKSFQLKNSKGFGTIVSLFVFGAIFASSLATIVYTMGARTL